MSLLNLILPTHAKLGRALVGRVSPSAPSATLLTAAQVDEELAVAQVALRDMIEDRDWKRARAIAEHIAHRCKIRGYEAKCDAAGVVRH